jgi:hypothetical protein
MRKILFVVVLMVLVLTACNFPLVNPKPQADSVATSVVLTLNALPSSTPPPTETVAPTLEITTPAPTETSTATITPTTPPGDPLLTLGDPSFSDTFTSGRAFDLEGKTYDDGAVKISVSSGAMHFVSSTINAGKRWRLTSPQPRNFYLEGTFKILQCSGYDHYGLVMRSPKYDDGIGYYFAVSCNGRFTFERWDGSGITDVVIWTVDTNIKSGPNQTNRLGIKAEDNNFKLYLNGVLVKEVSDAGLPAKGHFGAYITALENSSFSVDLEELREWNLP